MNKYEQYQAAKPIPRLYVGQKVTLISGQQYTITGSNEEGMYWGLPGHHDAIEPNRYAGWYWNANGVYRDGVSRMANINMELINE